MSRSAHLDNKKGIDRHATVAEDDDYFVLKPKHSGFFSTTLNVLLEYLQVRTLIIGGFAGNICVLFTANDAYMREYNLFVPQDCSASNTTRENEEAMAQIEKVLKADVRSAAKLVEMAMFRDRPKRQR
jgi:nicotinamidase-related amidase